jgi:hypothetical protein
VGPPDPVGTRVHHERENSKRLTHRGGGSFDGAKFHKAAHRWLRRCGRDVVAAVFSSLTAGDFPVYEFISAAAGGSECWDCALEHVPTCRKSGSR